MADEEKDTRKEVLEFAMKELSRMIKDMKNGKQVQVSKEMKKLASEVTVINEQTEKKKVSEEEIKQWADKILKDLTKSKSKK